MNFLNPIVLLGLIASGIPILLHLLNLRRLKTVEFSTLRFLKELQKTKIRRLKIKQIILLILRTLIIIFLVFAFSRPTIEGTLPGFESFGNTSAVILVDNSFSMDVSDGNGNRLNQAKNHARSILDAMKEGDEILVIEMSDANNREQYSFSRNLPLVEEKINQIKTSNTKADLKRSLELAYLLLDESVNINKEIFIISDLQRNIISGYELDSSAISSIGTNIYTIPVGLDFTKNINNVWVDSLEIVSRIFQQNKPIQLNAYIKNNSSQDISTSVVSLNFNKERISQKSMNLTAGQTKSVSFSALPNSEGAISASIELEPDVLDIDNKRYFGAIIPEKPQVAVFTDGIANFLRIALEAQPGGDKYVDYQRFSSSKIGSVDLNQFDIVIASGSSYSANDYDRLKNFVENGGSSIIFAANGFDEESKRKSIESLGFGMPSRKEFSPSSPAVFSNVDKMHPLFEGVFKGSTGNNKIVESPNISMAYPVNGGRKVIEMPGGNFMSESILGNGKALYIAVTPDLEWSNFALTGIFPTLIYRSIVYLSAKEALSNFAKCNESYLLFLPRKYSAENNFKIIDPLGNESFMQAALMPTGAALTFNSLDIPGVYTIQTMDGKNISQISVNVDVSESDVTPISTKDLERTIRDHVSGEYNIEFLDSADDLSEKITRVRTGTELWQIFLLLAILAAIAEMIIEKNSKDELKEA